jgi:3-oxoacyl-(acyl-carrier-protein) synthase
MSERIVVTGMGICCALGADLGRVLEMLRRGRTGVGPIGSFDTTEFTMKHAGELRNPDPSHCFSPEEAIRLDRATQMAVLAAAEAFENAALEPAEIAGERTGLVAGATGIGQFPNDFVTRAPETEVCRKEALLARRGVPHFQVEELAQRFHRSAPLPPPVRSPAVMPSTCCDRGRPTSSWPEGRKACRRSWSPPSKVWACRRPSRAPRSVGAPG